MGRKESLLKIHEYQAKQILARYGIPVPKSEVAFSVEEAKKGAETLGEGVRVVKAQIHAGGRGKGGGVKVTTSTEQCHEAIESIFGMQLVTHQTGPEGKEVTTLLIEEGCDIAREIYCGLVIDRAAECPVLMVSSEGGMDIEEVAAERPEAIHKAPISGDGSPANEYMAIRWAASKVRKFRNLLQELGHTNVIQLPTKVYCDNNTAIHWLKTGKITDGNQYLDLAYHQPREWEREGKCWSRRVGRVRSGWVASWEWESGRAGGGGGGGVVGSGGGGGICWGGGV